MRINPFIKRWTIANVIGSCLAYLFVALTSSLIPALFADKWTQMFLLMIISPFVLIIGSYILGKAQWWGLKELIPNIKTWGCATSLGYSAGGAIGFGIFYFNQGSAFVALIAIILTGAFIGMVQTCVLPNKFKKSFLWIPTQSLLLALSFIEIFYFIRIANFYHIYINGILTFFILLIFVTAVYGLLSGLVLRSLVRT
ncbi:hypothetical protein Pse7367_2371 [Thalassoporum mexicanum PCC 7367]|uniref:hypothetical protein n=1 Tax=Thalassoporum mexicanum TaxID=3457544 RepID=UPI00029FEF24|nr:hypothetical protein [Pseudanabaena sp. PCC 7367]AFY70632.1 hypothetical protein Pse7367_2371 [Pseudanabaena sp. PCC 7367]